MNARKAKRLRRQTGATTGRTGYLGKEDAKGRVKAVRLGGGVVSASASRRAYRKAKKESS